MRRGPVNYAQIIKDIGPSTQGGGDLDTASARELFSAMLDGGVPDLQLGALLIALRAKGESVDELLGFYDALASRLYRLPFTEQAIKPVVIPSYGGAQRLPNLLALLALSLKRYGIPVLIHGSLESHGRVTTAHILRELGVMPSATPVQAAERLAHDGIAFVPVAALSPGLAALLSLRAPLGLRNTAHVMCKLLDPLAASSVRIVPHSNPAFTDKSRAMMIALGADALVMGSTEGEAFANPQRRPKMEHVHDGACTTLFEAEAADGPIAHNGPDGIDAKATADWIRLAITGSVPIPHPLLNQLSCCLYACGYTETFNQAKAIVAIETGNLAAV
jgi:anthranilate phosphoribosyltransferase